MGQVIDFVFLPSDDESEDEENSLYRAVLSGNWEKIVNALFTNSLDSSNVVSFYHENSLNKVPPGDEELFIPHVDLWQKGVGCCETINCRCSEVTPIVTLFTSCDNSLISDLISFKLLRADDITDEEIRDIFFFLPITNRYNFTLLMLQLLSLDRILHLEIFFTVSMMRNGERGFRVVKEHFNEEHRKLLLYQFKTQYFFERFLSIKTTRDF